ncbi:MAG TPA: FUSC family protein [Acidisarcina sp.]
MAIRNGLRARLSSGLPPSMVRMVGRMEWFRGLRAATAITAPMLLAGLLHRPALAWAALGGFEAILSDTGGPYRQRIQALGLLALGGCAGAFLGTLAGSHMGYALPVTMLWCFAWSYLLVLGSPFSSTGVLIEVIYLCGLGAGSASGAAVLHASLGRTLRATLPLATSNAEFLFGGALWATLLSLLLWPLDPYRPARQAVAACYRELASFLSAIVELDRMEGGGAEGWQSLAREHQGRMRRGLELAAEAVTGIRAQGVSESVRVNHLTVLLESADMLLARTIAVAEYFESSQRERPASLAAPGVEQAPAGGGGQAADGAGSRYAGESACVARGKSSLESLRDAELWIAELLRRRPQRFEEATHARRRRLACIPGEISVCLEGDDAEGRYLLHQITEITQNLDTGLESAVAVLTAREGASAAVGVRGAGMEPGAGGAVGHGEGRGEAAPGSAPGMRPCGFEEAGTLTAWGERLWANWKVSSLSLRHALRVAVVCGLGVAILYRFHISHGYWLPITSLIVLQPHASGTFRRSLQRVAGTVAGGVLAALLAVYLHSTWALAAALFPLAVLSLAVLPLNYMVYCFFLTPTFILVSLPYFGDWRIAGIRMVNTGVGALLALGAMAFLWPAWERDRFAQQLRCSIEADRRYLEALMAAWQKGASTGQLTAARRAAGLAHNDSEDSLDRVILEPSSFLGQSGGGEGGGPVRGNGLARAVARVFFTPAAAPPVMQAAISVVAYLRRFAQSITSLVSAPPDAGWQRSVEVTSRLEAMRGRLDELGGLIGGEVGARSSVRSAVSAASHEWRMELRGEREPGEAPDPAGEPAQEAAPVEADEAGSAEGDEAAGYAVGVRAAGESEVEHAGERLLSRMERQLLVLRRNLLLLEEAGLLGSDGTGERGGGGARRSEGNEAHSRLQSSQ